MEEITIPPGDLLTFHGYVLHSGRAAPQIMLSLSHFLYSKRWRVKDASASADGISAGRTEKSDMGRAKVLSSLEVPDAEGSFAKYPYHVESSEIPPDD